MRYLVSTLVAEGVTDHRFLRPLIRNVLAELVTTSPESVDIGIFIDVRAQNRSLEEIRDALARDIDKLHLVFLHADGGGQPDRARRDRVTPIVDSFRERVDAGQLGCVAIVPVHETEAWALADETALREVLVTRRSADELGIPPITAIEGLDGPKVVLDRICLNARGGRRRHRPDRPYDQLGDRVTLDRLRRLAAFRAFEEELAAALRRLRVIP